MSATLRKQQMIILCILALFTLVALTLVSFAVVTHINVLHTLLSLGPDIISHWP